MSRRTARMAAAVPLLVLWACGPEEPATGPPDIRYGEVVCARCGMSVDDARFAAALRYTSGDGSAGLAVYDDVGEMFLAIAAARSLALREMWVHDAASGAWIDAAAAFFVRGEIKSPMGIGVEAYEKRKDAERRARDVRGEVFDFNALLNSAREGKLATKREEES